MATNGSQSAFMKVYKRIFHDFNYELDLLLHDCDSILDVGCGKSSPVQYLPKRGHLVGVDLFKPSIEKSRAKGIHDEYHVMNVLDIDKKFKPSSFDAVIALDLIEHLTKEEARNLIKKMERIAKKIIIVFTPNGFFHQDEFDKNVLQEHKSGWETHEMRKLGFKVVGVHGWRPLRAKVVDRNDRLVRVIWLFLDISQLYVRDRPDKAFQILCSKDKE